MKINLVSNTLKKALAVAETLGRETDSLPRTRAG